MHLKFYNMQFNKLKSKKNVCVFFSLENIKCKCQPIKTERLYTNTVKCAKKIKLKCAVWNVYLYDPEKNELNSTFNKYK